MVDLSGSIPTFVQNFAAKGQASILKYFTEGYVKRFAK